MNATASDLQDRIAALLPLAKQFRDVAASLGSVPQAALDAINPERLAEHLAEVNGNFNDAVTGVLALMVDEKTAAACNELLKKTRAVAMGDLKQPGNEQSRRTLLDAIGLSKPAEDFDLAHN